MRTIRFYTGHWRMLLLVAALSVTIQSVALAGAKDARGNLGHVIKKTMLLFPFDVASETAANAEEMSVLLTDVAASRLIATNSYSVTTYYKAWPPVARLHYDQQLGEADVIAPFADDNRKSVRIAKLVGYDTVFVGSLDDYEYNETQKQVTVSVSGRIIVAETGQVLKSVSLSATSIRGGERTKEEDLNLDAARKGAEKLMGQLAPAGAGATTTEPPKVVVEKKKRSSSWIWGLLAIGVGLGIGLSGGGGSGGSGIENPPPPPR